MNRQVTFETQGPADPMMIMQGHPFEEAVERLHTLYRQELQTRRVQAEARQRLTGTRPIALPTSSCLTLAGKPRLSGAACISSSELAVKPSPLQENPSTFFPPTGQTQIDYIITRQCSANLQAKRAYPDHTFPIGGSRLSGHHPIRAQLPMQSYHKPPSQEAPTGAPIDLAALQAAVSKASPEALDMQARIANRLQQVDITNLVSTHRHVNRILLEEAVATFPKQMAADNRVSAQPEYRISARSVWHLYRELKKPRVCTPHEIFAKWKLATAFARASKALRRQSHYLKKQFYESQVDQAEAAAHSNDQRSLFLIVRRLSPKSTRNMACRLRGDDGRLLTGPEEMQHIVAYGNKTFAAKDDDYPRAPLSQAVQITAQDITAELRKLGISKAVPRHIAPAAVWKQCSQAMPSVPTCNLGVQESSTRPIGLSSPASKALARSLRHHLLHSLEPMLRFNPQFAYTKNRGTADALLRAHMHFEAVSRLVQSTQCTRFQKQAGCRERSCVGGLGLSLDLSKAFDGVTRAHIYRSMAQHGVPHDVITIIQQLHHRAQYLYASGSHRGSTMTSNGIKQGCVIAPYLWNYFSLVFLSMLQADRSADWIQRVLTLFADDVWGAWELSNAEDLDRAIADVTLILEALETLDMTINYGKTAILLKLVGKDARRLKHDRTIMKAGQLHLKLTVHGRECLIPIKDQHEYLGTVVTYRHRMFNHHHGQDLAINEEAAIFANCWSEPPEHEKAFVLFMRQGEDGTLGALVRVAREWNNKKSQENPTVRSPLRTVLLSSMAGELLKLAQQAVATEENKQKMIKAEWLTANSEWNYRTWNHAERRLVVDTARPPLQHAEIVRILNHLLEHLTGEAIQRFNSTVTLPKLEQQGANIATFALEVSLRGQAAAELYTNFEREDTEWIQSQLFSMRTQLRTLAEHLEEVQLASAMLHGHIRILDARIQLMEQEMMKRDKQQKSAKYHVTIPAVIQLESLDD
ncbi:hypothetical protein AK812_SmicGene44773 [Symbiodinium microadriaticum]|uniref:Uncharacterized protein n=1 Tax=Symbiodinium microadriaticum TaxID=2951 RepID=A0A1Q9BXK2_SYMMI|nr:hypothetical protein AK812_SmicGene44773 [Symbiodinium microadriaticum]CAE7726510.1 unnamed protein product [Symbiodinium microadriaticum]CAE7895658.1 unnamed protein product [Symbiodinium sp. KB8]